MMQSQAFAVGRRRALRRAVRVECEITSRYWGEPVSHRISNLSPYGAWVETAFPLSCGDKVVISMTPPQWGRETDMVVLAEVVRVGLDRRASDHSGTGMGVVFLDLAPEELLELSLALHGLPPPLPRITVEAELEESGEHRIEGIEERADFEISPLAPLLTGEFEVAASSSA